MSRFLIQEEGQAVKITIESEEEGKYNLVDVKFMHQFIDTLRALEREKRIRFVIIRGKGNFGAGADIRELKKASEDIEYATNFFHTMYEMFRVLFNFPKLIIANVEGIAYGASLELLLGFDFVIASENAKFAAPGGRIGVFPPVLVTIGKEILGWKAVREMAFLGKELTAKEAKEIGLVYEVADSFDDANYKLLQQLKQMAPTSLIQMRSLIYRKYDEELKYAFERLIEQVQTEDARNGIYAFLTRTKPNWAITP